MRLSLLEQVLFEVEKVHTKLCCTLQMQKIAIPPKSLFCWHGYLQRIGPDWEGRHQMGYQKYLIPETRTLGEPSIFANGSSFEAKGGTAGTRRVKGRRTLVAHHILHEK